MDNYTVFYIPNTLQHLKFSNDNKDISQKLVRFIFSQIPKCFCALWRDDYNAARRSEVRIKLRIKNEIE